MADDSEERLLRQAKEYIRQQEEKNKRESKSDRKKRHKKYDNKADDEPRSAKSRHRDEKKRSKEHDKDGDYMGRRSTSEERHRHETKRRGDKKYKKREKSDDDDSRRGHRKRHKKRSSRDDHKTKRSRHNKRIRSKEHLLDLGPPIGTSPEELLDAEKDYFQFHQHLWVYLFREEGVLFNDLKSSEAAREAFSRFVKKYNKGQLEKVYYESVLPEQVLNECKTTKHNWSFKISDAEGHSLSTLQQGVRKQTDYQGEAAAETTQATPSYNRRVQSTLRDDDHDHLEDRKNYHHNNRVATRRLKEHVRAAEEEFSGGRKEGWERQIEKRKEKAEKTHAASRDRDGVELTDDAIYGDESGFKEALLARERARKSRREQEQRNRVAELTQKAEEKQQEMLKKLGLTGIKPGQKIKIAPRRDGDG